MSGFNSRGEVRLTPEETLETILVAWADGEDLRANNFRRGFYAETFASAMDYYGTWDKALDQIGIDFDMVMARADEIKQERKEIIFSEKAIQHEEKKLLLVERIQELWDKGADLRTINANDNFLSEYKRSYKLYGGWKEALEAAGLDYEQVKARVDIPRREQKKQDLIAKIKSAYEAGKNLRPKYLQNEKPPEVSLYHAAKTLFGGSTFWIEALESAGINPSDIGLKQRWSEERILKKLKERSEAGLSMSPSEISKSDRGLAKAINNYMGYDAAMKAIGLRPTAHRKTSKHRTNEDILKAIKNAYKNGDDLKYESIMQAGPSKFRNIVRSAMRKFNGSWIDAVEAAGIDYSQFNSVNRANTWNKQVVIDSILELDGQGATLSAADIKSNYRPLYEAGVKYFGNWGAALVGSGFDDNNIRKIGRLLSKEKILEEIIRLQEEGESLTSSDTAKHKSLDVRRVRFSATFHYGGWKQAILAAGIDYNEITKARYYSTEELVAEVKLLESKGFDISVSGMKEDKNTFNMYHSAISRFHSWREFLEHAEIDPDKYGAVHFWGGKEEVIDELKSRYQSGIVYQLSKHADLVHACIKFFGSASDAVDEAGLIYARRKIYPELLQGRKAQKILYESNIDFFTTIANTVFWKTYGANYRTQPRDDLIHEAFLKFLEILPQKPRDKTIRQFTYWPIRAYLTNMNKDLFKESLFEEDVYMDLFRSDRNFIDEESDPGSDLWGDDIEPI